MTRKTLILIGGTMGVGKTTACRELYRMFARSVWLDGDWCWNMHPWSFSERNRRMVMENIAFLLNSFLRNDEFEVVLFGWVLHERAIIDEIEARLVPCDREIRRFSLICSEEELLRRMASDHRSEEGIRRGLARLSLYPRLGTELIDTTGLSPRETAKRIYDLVLRGAGGRTAFDGKSA
jgi:hypothetical protein